MPALLAHVSGARLIDIHFLVEEHSNVPGRAFALL
jgi:hypothetical protein